MLETKKEIINGKEFILSKVPATVGRKLATQYFTTSLPRIGDYEENEKLMYEMLSYVGVQLGDNVIKLSTPDLVNNHTGDWETLLSLEKAMGVYNCSFFQDGRASTLLEDFAQNMIQSISRMLTQSSD